MLAWFGFVDCCSGASAEQDDEVVTMEGKVLRHGAGGKTAAYGGRFMLALMTSLASFLRGSKNERRGSSERSHAVLGGGIATMCHV